jgi:hypothetical protein
MKRIPLVLLAFLSLSACGGSSGTSSDGAGEGTDTSTPVDTAAPADTLAPEQKIAGVVIDVTVGEDSGEDRTEKVALGSEVTLNITNPDEEDEFHLHGYDLSTGETPADETATITFTADKAGEFEMESHMSGEVLLVIVVE